MSDATISSIDQWEHGAHESLAREAEHAKILVQERG